MVGFDAMGMKRFALCYEQIFKSFPLKMYAFICSFGG